MFLTLTRHCVLIWILGLAANACSAQLSTDATIDHSIRSRQARADTVKCTVDVITHYTRESQFVPGQIEREPPLGRSQKRQVTLHLDGPAKFRLQHTGGFWHRRMGQIVDGDLTRQSDGVFFRIAEQPYESIPSWKPRPKLYRNPKLDSQENGWEDIVMTPILFHYRAFNARHSPIAEVQYHAHGNKTIGEHECVLYRPRPTAEFRLNVTHYWLAPTLNYAAVRIERRINREIDWQFDINYETSAGQWTPSDYLIRKMRDGRIAEFSKVNVRSLVINEPIPNEMFKIEMK